MKNDLKHNAGKNLLAQSSELTGTLLFFGFQRLQKIFVSAGTTAWLGTTGTTAGSVTTNF